jgi:checkpoint serine/threonine-protein kinase
VTINTKEAMDEIYDIFNQPLQEHTEAAAEAESENESSDDDDCTSAGESTGTGRMSGANSEFGEDNTAADFTLGTTVGDNDNSGSEGDDTDVKSISAWSEFTEIKHASEENQHHASDEDDSDVESFTEIAHVQTDEEVATPTSPGGACSLPIHYVPEPPEDYDVPTRPYRDPAVAANNRLPFMTPIVEKTESSLGIATAHTQKEYFTAKTPSRSKGAPTILEDDDELWSSPFQEVFQNSIEDVGRVAKLSLKEVKPVAKSHSTVSLKKDMSTEEVKHNGPIIQDAQCNPVDEAIREAILREIQPPLSSYEGYFADTERIYGKGGDIRKYTKAVTKANNRQSSDKTATNLTTMPIIKFEGSNRTYTVKKELGKGAFAPVYLTESVDLEEREENCPVQMGKGDSGRQRHSLEAIKMEEPPSPWEFYIMRQAKRRLGASRPVDSIIYACEMHMFKDECYLIEEFRDQGTLLDLVNIARAENGAMDEQLAMFFTIELFRIVETLHSKGLIHGDLKADNILVRFDMVAKDGVWDSQYRRDGTGGWASKGIALIDFGRGIDMKAFIPNVQFIADWPTTEADCAEMRELRPWTYQIDYHGLAGIIHNLLFGKYLSTVAERAATLGAGATKTYRIKESLKRYWQTEIWQEALDLLLNPLMHISGEAESKMPVVKGMKEVREKMEVYLEGSCEKGVGLKALVRRMEEAVKKR